jgi:hypothetical protein
VSDSIPKYAVDGVPTALVRSETSPSEWENVFVFPDPERPYRRGFIGSCQQVILGSQSMAKETHIWEGQGEVFFNKAAAEFGTETGVKDVLSKKAPKSLQDVLQKLLKPGVHAMEESPDVSQQDGKRKSLAASSCGSEANVAGASLPSSPGPSVLSKNVMRQFGERASAPGRSPSPVEKPVQK